LLFERCEQPLLADVEVVLERIQIGQRSMLASRRSRWSLLDRAAPAARAHAERD
jgi:hypothetical protein